MHFEAKKFIDILESSDLFELRENELSHTPYETEKHFYAVIKNGNVQKAKETAAFIKEHKIVAGKLSDNSLTQMKYWAVCCITLATRAAIEGGLDENTAFVYADKTIMKIDRLQTEAAVFSLILDEYIKITALVFESSECKNHSIVIKRCINYISTHLHENLSVKELAMLCGLSTDHFSKTFKTQVGCSPLKYIQKKKLTEAKEMLLSGKSISETAYYLGYCSESYFIKCFQKEFLKTPKQFLKSS